MTPDQLTSAIVNGINGGGEGFLEGTLAAVLPIIWLAIIALVVLWLVGFFRRSATY